MNGLHTRCALQRAANQEPKSSGIDAFIATVCCIGLAVMLLLQIVEQVAP